MISGFRIKNDIRVAVRGKTEESFFKDWFFYTIMDKVQSQAKKHIFMFIAPASLSFPGLLVGKDPWTCEETGTAGGCTLCSATAGELCRRRGGGSDKWMHCWEVPEEGAVQERFSSLADEQRWILHCWAGLNGFWQVA